MYCSKCGGAMPDGSAFCSACGQAFTAAAVMPRAPMMNAPAYGAPPVPTSATAPRVEYAGFWLRAVAFVIDSVVMGVGIVAVLIPLFFLTGLGGVLSRIHPEGDMNDFGIFLIIGIFFMAATVSLMVTWLYHAFMESSEWQATLGKKVLGLVVTDMAGQRVSFGRSTGRHFAKIVTNLVSMGIGLGYLMAAFTEKKQALHDMIAGCLVLRRT